MTEPLVDRLAPAPAGGPGRAGWRRRGRDVVRSLLVPADRAGRLLALISLIDAIGTGMYYTGGALYFTLIVGLTPGTVGTGFALSGLAGLLLTVPVGLVADRVGAGRVLIALHLWRGLCNVGFCLVGDATQFIAVATCVGVAEGATPPNHQATVAAMVRGPQRLDTLAKVRAVRNVGFGAGALAATAAIGGGARAGYLALVAGNALSFFVAAFLLARIGAGASPPRRDEAAGGARQQVRERTSAGAPSPGGGRLPVSPRYLVATLLNGVLSLHTTVLALGLPLWVVGHTRVPQVLVGPLVAGNTVLAVLLQARLARPAARLSGAARAAVRAGIALAGCAVALQLAGRVPWMPGAVAVTVAAVVLLTLAELWQSAAGWTISAELAPAGQHGRYLAVFQLGVTLQSIAAPLMITGVVLPGSFGWVGLGVAVLACGLAVPRVVERGHRMLGPPVARPR